MKFTVTVVLLDHKLYSFYLQPYSNDSEAAFLSDNYYPMGKDVTQVTSHYPSYEAAVSYINSIKLHPLAVPDGGIDAEHARIRIPDLGNADSAYVSFYPNHTMTKEGIEAFKSLFHLDEKHHFFFPYDILTDKEMEEFSN